jgi:osmotically-inducible protein OsmY
MQSQIFRLMALFFNSRQLLAATIAALMLVSGCTSLVSATREDPIGEDYSKRTAGAYVDDEFIETKTAVNIKKNDSRFKQAQVNIDSYNGVVLLTGNVPDADMRDIATNTVKRIRKVRSVHNELRVSPPRSFSNKLSDGWLSTKIKTRLLFDKHIRSSQYEVIVNNGAIYLMGLTTRADADKIVRTVEKSYGVQKIVRVFEYIN